MDKNLLLKCLLYHRDKIQAIVSGPPEYLVQASSIRRELLMLGEQVEAMTEVSQRTIDDIKSLKLSMSDPEIQSVEPVGMNALLRYIPFGRLYLDLRIAPRVDAIRHDLSRLHAEIESILGELKNART